MPEKPEPTGLERQLEQLTAELKRVGEAFRDNHQHGRESAERFRNPHDHTGEYDRLDRKEPVVMDNAHYMLYLPGLKQRTRRVPGRAVEFGEDDEGDYAFIECPCGAKPIARAGIEKCPGCERRYLLTGKGPLVVYGDMEPPSQKVSD
jgi:hypothetical protein